MVITANPPKFDKRQPSRGDYDAIVYIQDDEVIAEDATGDEILSGTAGTDDATIINAAIDSITTAGLVSVFGQMTLNEAVIPKANVIIDANMPERAASGSIAWLVNCESGLVLGNVDAGTIGYGIRNLRLRSATALTNTGIDIRRAHYTNLENISFYNFNKAINIQGCYTSRFSNIYNLYSNYGLYSQYLADADTADLVITGCKLANCNKYCMYLEANSVTNLHVWGGILESMAGGYDGNSVYIGASNVNVDLSGLYMGINSVSKYIIYDRGIYTKISNCELYKGIVELYTHASMTNCRLGGAIKLNAVGDHVSLTGCKIEGATSIEYPIYVTGDKAIISNCNFENSACKWYIYVNSGNDTTISNCTFESIDRSRQYPGASYPIKIVGTGIQVYGCNFNTNPYAAGAIENGATSPKIHHNVGYVTENSGSSTGTGSEQTIPHGLAAIPTGCKAWITYLVGGRYVTEMVPFDATNIYPTVDNGVAYTWRIE